MQITCGQIDPKQIREICFHTMVGHKMRIFTTQVRITVKLRGNYNWQNHYMKEPEKITDTFFHKVAEERGGGVALEVFASLLGLPLYLVPNVKSNCRVENWGKRDILFWPPKDCLEGKLFLYGSESPAAWLKYSYEGGGIKGMEDFCDYARYEALEGDTSNHILSCHEPGEFYQKVLDILDLKFPA